jgi:histidine ammonia-lyase
MNDFNYGVQHLSIGTALDIASGKVKGVINAEAAEKIRTSWKEVEKIVHAQKPVYGINTGFGPLCDTSISEKDTSLLQSNILKSHSVGVGKPIPQEIAKLMLITKVQALAQGYSGISPKTLERVIWHIDNDVIPVVPEKGSVGASGDLAPLAHLFLPLLGLGRFLWVMKNIPQVKYCSSIIYSHWYLAPKKALPSSTARSLFCHLPSKRWSA